MVVAEDADVLDRISLHMLPALAPDPWELIEFDGEPLYTPRPLEPVKITLVFLGKASRGCQRCRMVKLYREFNKSTNPAILCRYCAAEVDNEIMLTAMTDDQRAELAFLEDSIIDSEIAYEEALERQELVEHMLELMED